MHDAPESTKGRGGTFFEVHDAPEIASEGTSLIHTLSRINRQMKGRVSDI